MNQKIPNLPLNEVHVWKYLINEHSPIPQIKGALSPSELKISYDFQFKKDQNISIVSKYMLKNLLSAYTKSSTEKILLRKNQYQKPFIESSDIQFNLSHSKNSILIGIARNEIGVDVEYSNKELDVFSIVNKFFSPLEISELKALPKKEIRPAFYNLWTRKEAVIKAIGDGLNMPLNEFSVEAVSKKEPKLISINWKEEKAHHWKLFSFKPYPDYQAAVAIRNTNAKFRLLEFEL